MEPRYEGEPILAVAAVSEQIASDAIELIDIDLEPLEFVLDPLDSLKPGGPNARSEGNTTIGRELGEIKWTAADLAGLAAGEIPMDAEAAQEWSFGDLEAGFAEADIIVEEHSYNQSTSHQPLESRTTMAYWEDGKLYIYPVRAEHRARRGPDGPVGGRRALQRRAHQRVHGRRVRRQDQRLRARADSHPAVEEDRQAGHDAHHAARREHDRPRAPRRPGPHPARDARRRPHHRPRHPRHRRPGSVRALRRRHERGGHRVALLPAAGLPHARHQRLHQHPAAGSAAGAGRRAVDDHARAHHPEGGEAAGARPGRGAQDQRAGRPGAVRPAGAERRAGQRVERVRPGGDRHRRRALQLGGAQAAQRPAQRLRRSPASA